VPKIGRCIKVRQASNDEPALRQQDFCRKTGVGVPREFANRAESVQLALTRCSPEMVFSYAGFEQIGELPGGS
jgi:hypothetical protein